MITLVHNKFTIKNFEQEEIDKCIDESRALACLMLMHNREILDRHNKGQNTKSDNHYKLYKLWKTDSYNWRSDCYLRPSINGVDEIQESNGALIAIINCIDSFQKRLKNSTLRDKDILPTITANNLVQPNIPYIVTSYKLPPGAICSICGIPSTIKNLAKHQQTLACAERARRNALKDAGLVVTYDLKLINMAKNGMLNHDKVPIRYDWYVPKWAEEGQKLFRDGDGYAGMEFSDFILKLNPKVDNEDDKPAN